MITSDQISAAKQRTKYSYGDKHHEHDDCIRIAYEWLDAQTTIKGKMRKTLPIKHIIEKWAGRYVSQSDVEVAAELHPRITGTYPDFNLSARLTRPLSSRLENIGEAMTQGYHENFDPKVYQRTEA